jgi:peptidoglycan/LPS O-acetylase OafA/YrhL
VPESGVIDPQLWTLRYETLCYGMLALFVLIGALANRRRTNLTLAALLAGYAVVTFATDWRQQMSGVDSAMRFMLAFFIGGSFYLFGHHIRLQLGVAVTLAASAALAPQRLRQVSRWPMACSGSPRIPTGVIRSFNGLGDYSYGLYSLSFPIQQTFILMDRIFTPGALLVCSFPALLGLAMQSWHLVEQPALRRKVCARAWLHNAWQAPR